MGSSRWTFRSGAAGVAALAILAASGATSGAAADRAVRRATWGPVVDLAASPSVSRPDVVLGPRGGATVVWRTQNGIIAISRSPEGRWGDPVRLGNGTTPAAAVDARGRVTVIWVRHVAGMGPQVMTADRAPGKAWSRARALSRAVPSHGSSFPGAFRPRLAVGHGGAAAVTWMWGADDSGGSRVQARYRPAGDAWRDPVFLSPVEARTPEIAVGDGGHAVVTYTVNARLFAVRRTSSGWGPRQRVGLHAQPPQVAMDERGRATVVWSGFDPSGGQFHPRAVTARPGEAWSEPVTLDPQGTRSLPVVGLDRFGRSTVAWTRDGEVLASSHPLGGTWTAPQPVAEPGEPLADAPPALGLTVARGGATLLTWTVGPSGSQAVEGRFHPAGAGWEPARRLSLPDTDAAAAETHVGPGAVAAWRAYDDSDGGRPHVQLRFLRP